MQKSKTILVAEEHSAINIVSSALKEFALLEATRFEQAQRLILDAGIDLVVIGIHFDESRAVELIKCVKTSENHHSTPIIVLRLTPSELADVLRNTLSIMKSLSLVDLYLELEGMPDAAVQIRKAVDKQLSSAKVSSKKMSSSRTL